MKNLTHALSALACLLLLGPSALAACGPVIDSVPFIQTEPALGNPVASPTPFLPTVPTATPEPIRFWISAALPDALREALTSLKLPTSSVRLVESSTSADVRAEANPDVSLSTWVYALVAPFPTLDDGVTSEQLEAIWSGDDGSLGPLYVAPEDIEILRAGLEFPEAVGVNAVRREDLLAQAWAERPALAVIPFEDLDPRWKVLEVDGVSPIRRDFEAATYPLSVPLGLSGSAEAIDEIKGSMEWPPSNRDEDRITIVIMTGVSALTRGTAWRMESKGVAYPAELIGEWLNQADITHVSHEVAFLDSCPKPDPLQASLRFCSDPSNVGLFDLTGVDVIELTGNHVMDFGAEALLDTLRIYHERGWQIFGGGEDLKRAFEPALFEHHGNRLAFLGCNAAGPSFAWATEDSPGGTPCDEARLFEDVARLEGEGYLTLFTYQWSESMSPTPGPAQMDAFRRAAEAGATIVSGSQAHRPQTLEFYTNALIHYGLGNLFFDQMWSLPTRQEVIDRHVFYDGRHISTELLTAVLEDYAQPRPMTDEERLAFLAEIFKASGW